MNTSTTAMYERTSVKVKAAKKNPLSGSKQKKRQDKKQGKKLIKYVQIVEIVFYKIPNTYQKLLDEADTYSKSHNALVTWLRHNRTNYEELINSCYNRYSCTYEDRLLAVDILRKRSADLCSRLVKQLREET